jgi:DNA mismatch repair protein MutS2
MKNTYIYPDNGLEKLEYHKITQLVAQHCIGELGLRYLQKMQISSDYDFILKALNQVNEFKTLLENDEPFPSDNFIQLDEVLNYLEINNSVLTEEQFQMMLLFLHTISDIYAYFKKREDKYTSLQTLLRGEGFEQSLLKNIATVISIEGHVKSGVSPELDRIRKDIVRKERELDKKFQSIMLQAQENGWLASGGESIKNGRRVLTLQAEYKRRIKGIIHDESATGKTVFLEPEQTIELSNDWFELKQEERREIYRILRELSNQVRPSVPAVRFYQRLASVFDFIRAKALVAIDLRATLPQLEKDPVLQLLRAYHPVLYLHNQKLDKKTIPLNVDLDDENHILIISGPNAGGKSVTLKTIGLLQSMLQSGMLVPVSPDSKMGIFNKILIELGDEQSIENDLSTYSSHLQHMRRFSEQADEKSLFLIDEFGTGTDPKFGGAIAEAILEDLNAKKAFGVVTTHYSNLKLYASNNKGVLNGSMLFDTETLNPLYVLKIGQPGSSYAFEIAQKIGLPETVISSARDKIDKDYQNFDALLATMETDKHLMELQQQKLTKNQEELDKLITSYQQLRDDMERNKQKIILDTKEKALKEADQNNRRMEQMLKELHQSTEKKSAEKKIREEIGGQREKLKQDVKTLREKAKPQKEPAEVKVGAQVKMIDGTEVGFVEELRKDKALVAFKSLKTLVNIKDLEVVKMPIQNVKKRITGIDYANVANDFSPSIDVRGKRVDEALGIIESQLDKAMLLSFHSLRILHGKGDGILRKAIRELLSKYDIVKEYKSENPDFGGEGITLVELK